VSYIDVIAYDGDAEEYRRDEPDGPQNNGTWESRRTFREDEEFDAAQYLLSLLSERTHFDVRHTVF